MASRPPPQKVIRVGQPAKQTSVTGFLDNALTQIGYVFKYLRASRKRKLYKQWVAASDLPPDAIPDDLAEDPKYEAAWNKLKIILLYLALAVALVIIIGGVVLLLLNR